MFSTIGSSITLSAFSSFGLNTIELTSTTSVNYDNFINDLKIPGIKESKSVVVVGAGITGITTSIILAKAGLNVTLMEKDNCIGGTVSKYIPNFRFLSDTFLRYEKILHELNVKIIYNKKLGDNLLISDLEEYDYQVICIGAQNPTKLWKEEHTSVFSGLEILEQYNQNNCELKNKLNKFFQKNSPLSII